jgi:hypothetical protein
MLRIIFLCWVFGRMEDTMNCFLYLWCITLHCAWVLYYCACVYLVPVLCKSNLLYILCKNENMQVNLPLKHSKIFDILMHHNKMSCFVLRIHCKMVFCYQNCSDLLWEKIVLVIEILKFEAEGREFAKILRSLEQFIQTVKGQNNFW